MLLIVLLPVALVVRAKIRSHSNSAGAVESILPSHNSEAQLADMNSTPSSLQVVDHSPSQASSAGIHRWFQVPARGKDYRLVHALLSIDMWLMLIATSCGLGTVSTFYNNLGQLSASLGYSTARMNIFVALLNLWDFLGAIGCGFVSEILLHKFGIGRPFVFAAVVGFLALGNLLIALGLPGALYIDSIIIGLATGGQWAVLSTIIAEIFGLKPELPKRCKGDWDICCTKEQAIQDEPSKLDAEFRTGSSIKDSDNLWRGQQEQLPVELHRQMELVIPKLGRMKKRAD
ncbi:uncharacterized protein LOC112342073 [Selaginella moellendorffii]|uniref:uncharacterized protein LOC112342073 n=1 Tax=Selaginella moellendorffii TaxID=88036 RepID=UPI000D1C2934|nr:uncharacterized protein LOC112342073 [Selaginella moellendorffii]|eukprot:XP_024519057.1 uncharacterized protein LOC112342073 [Selaginella moellendorffii]